MRRKPTQEEWDEETRRHNARVLTVSREEQRREDRKDKEKYDRVYSQYRKRLDEQAELRQQAELAKLRLRTQGR